MGLRRLGIGWLILSFKWFYAAAGDRDDSLFCIQLAYAQNAPRLQVPHATHLRPQEIHQKTHAQGIAINYSL